LPIGWEDLLSEGRQHELFFRTYPACPGLWAAHSAMKSVTLKRVYSHSRVASNLYRS
jgi:hypothetical protein